MSEMNEVAARAARAGLVERTAAGVAARSPFDADSHLRLIVEGCHVGWLPRAHAIVLRSMQAEAAAEGTGAIEWVGAEAHGTIALLPGRHDFASRSAALARLAKRLADAGHVRGWRNELFAVTPALDGPAFATIERAAARYLGLLTFASHMNGIIDTPPGQPPALWVSRRSPSKSVDPGMWDNLVAGGMPHGSAPLETLVRECDEESGIPQALAARAEAHGMIEVLREIPEGVQWEQVFVYDLVLPADFVPVNRDGEVAEHRRIAPAALLAIMADRAMTVDATLVTLDALRRRGWA